MANTNAPRGLLPTKGAYSQPYSAGVASYVHSAGDSTALFVGDLVLATGETELINIGGSLQSFPVATRAATGDIFDGVVVSVQPVTRDTPPYAPASQQVVVYVCIDPNAEFIAQDISTGTPLAPDDVGLNINVSVAAGSTVTGYSGTTLNNGTEAGTNTLDLKLMRQWQSPDNELGTSDTVGAASGRWVVRINRHRFANQIAGI